jgi:hypothetical protein
MVHEYALREITHREESHSHLGVRASGSLIQGFVETFEQERCRHRGVGPFSQRHHPLPSRNPDHQEGQLKTFPLPLLDGSEKDLRGAVYAFTVQRKLHRPLLRFPSLYLKASADQGIGHQQLNVPNIQFLDVLRVIVAHTSFASVVGDTTDVSEMNVRFLS